MNSTAAMRFFRVLKIEGILTLGGHKMSTLGLEPENFGPGLRGVGDF